MYSRAYVKRMLNMYMGKFQDDLKAECQWKMKEVLELRKSHSENYFKVHSKYPVFKENDKELADIIFKSALTKIYEEYKK